MILIENFRLICPFKILRSPSEGNSLILGRSARSHPRGGRNAEQFVSENKAPVKTSQTVLLKEALNHQSHWKKLCVCGFLGNVANICKRFGLLNRGVA